MDDRGEGSGGEGTVALARDGVDPERSLLRRPLPIALGVAGGIVLAEASLAMVFRLRSILVLLLLSLFLSFAIEPAVNWLEDRGVRRGIGTGLVYVVIVALSASFLAGVSGLVADQATALSRQAPSLLEDLARQAEQLPDSLAEPVTSFLEEQSADVPDWVGSLAGELPGRLLGVGETILGVVFSTLSVALITFYMVADGPRLRRQLLRRMARSRQRELLHLWDLAIAKTGGYVYSRLVLAIASAVVHTVAFTMLDLPYAVALGVWMGLVSSVVPVVGVYLAGAVPVVVAIAEPDVPVLAILVVITVYQQLENYIVQPRITAHSLSLNPAVAFVAVLVGAALLGAVGALLALPVAAIIAALITTYAEEHEVVEHDRPVSRPPRTA